MLIIDVHDKFLNVLEFIDEINQRIYDAKNQKIKVLKIIHGYGSSGVGGDSKKAVNQLVKSKYKSKEIKLGICCDKMNEFNDKVASEFRLNYAKLVSKEDKKSNNPGITYIFF